MSKHEQIPEWVTFGEGARIHPSVVFVPYEDRKTVIRKRSKIDSGSVIYGGAKVGNDCIVRHNTVVRFNVEIGHHSAHHGRGDIFHLVTYLTEVESNLLARVGWSMKSLRK
jgi:UDP-3-O-[3-hydroxymyristoyl] glucosamine N-acyltransferase